jgi:1-acyl-sn-glycerol-3-phosphate acyltransferase
MLFLRSVLFLIGQIITAIIFTVIAFCTLPLNAVLANKIIAGWARCMIWWLRITCNITHQISGIENITNTPSIILSKHQSAWETLAFQSIFPAQCYVMKRSLLWIPIFGWGLACSSPIAIDRSAGREALKKLVANGKNRLAKGLFVVVFPEGTRKAPGEHSKYHIGGAWLAAQTQTAIVPVAHNAGEYWPKNGFIKRPGTIHVHIGKPIISSGRKADALNTQVETWIETEMKHLHG